MIELMATSAALIGAVYALLKPFETKARWTLEQAVNALPLLPQWYRIREVARITGGPRSPETNAVAKTLPDGKRAPGHPRSWHLLGRALDVSLKSGPTRDRAQLEALAKEIRPLVSENCVILVEDDHVHMEWPL